MEPSLIFGHWFEIIETAGVIGSLWFTAVSLRSDTKTQQIANLLTITGNHRKIWKEFLNNPKLGRVRAADADIIKQPVTDAERVFVNMVIQHVNSVYYTMSNQLVVEYEGLRRDIAQFFSRPIPRDVWDKIKIYQNNDFVAFVESCRNLK